MRETKLKRSRLYFSWPANLIFLLLVQGCSSSLITIKDSGPSPGSIDVSRIPDAIPRLEPKSKYGNPSSYVVFGKRYYVMESGKGYVESGIASWYGKKFHGRRTSSGETYDMYAMTAAHKSLPLPTYVEVRNLNNGKKVIVKVNDRGPFYENRIIDLSYTAATKLDIIGKGAGLVEVRAIGPVLYAKSGGTTSGAPVKSTSRIESVIQNTGFYIQVGAFSQLGNAQKLLHQLGSLGTDLIKISETIVSGNQLYRVRIGPLNDISFADSIVSTLIQYGITQYHITIN